MSWGTFWQRWTCGVRRLYERGDWTDLAGPSWAEDILSRAVTDRFHAKQGRSTGRLILQRGERRLAVYLKRHYRLPWWHGLLAAVWPGGDWSPGMAELRHLEWAHRQGLPVPAIAAAGEFIGPWGRLQSILALEELADMLPLNEAIPVAAHHLRPALFRRWKQGLIAEIARLARELHHRHWYHKDLYLCHFYIPREDMGRLPSWRGRVHLIDFHRLGRHPWTAPWWQLKDLAQLLYSSRIDGVNDRDRLRFWRLYRGDRRSWGNRWLRLGVLLKSRLYERHSRRRASAQAGRSAA
jgi:hypothetical protein